MCARARIDELWALRRVHVSHRIRFLRASRTWPPPPLPMDLTRHPFTAAESNSNQGPQMTGCMMLNVLSFV